MMYTATYIIEFAESHFIVQGRFSHSAAFVVMYTIDFCMWNFNNIVILTFSLNVHSINICITYTEYIFFEGQVFFFSFETANPKIIFLKWCLLSLILEYSNSFETGAASLTRNYSWASIHF